MARARNALRQVAKLGYWRESDARVLIEAWRATGESLAGFAKRHGVKPRRLTRWIQQLEESAVPALHPVRLVERSATIGGGGAIELRLAEGTRVFVPPGFTADDLRRVLAVLVESARC